MSIDIVMAVFLVGVFVLGALAAVVGLTIAIVRGHGRRREPTYADELDHDEDPRKSRMFPGAMWPNNGPWG